MTQSVRYSLVVTQGDKIIKLTPAATESIYSQDECQAANDAKELLQLVRKKRPLPKGQKWQLFYTNPFGKMVVCSF